MSWSGCDDTISIGLESIGSDLVTPEFPAVLSFGPLWSIMRPVLNNIQRIIQFLKTESKSLKLVSSEFSDGADQSSQGKLVEELISQYRRRSHPFAVTGGDCELRKSRKTRNLDSCSASFTVKIYESPG